MSSVDLSCSDLCSIIEGHFSTAACLYTFENSGELGETVHCEENRFMHWAMEFEKSDALETYFRYDKPALVCVRMALQNLGIALATLNKVSKKGFRGLCSRLNPFSKSEKVRIKSLVEDIVSEKSMLQYLTGTAKYRANFAAGIAKGAAAEVTVEEVPVQPDAAATGLTKGFGEAMVEEVQLGEICLME